MVRDYLKRLDPEYYQGEAWVHWSLTIEHRRTGWLSPMFLFRFREILTHTCFRYRVACLVYCLMPDHLHMLLHGLSPNSDQIKALAFFRKRSNESLRRIGFQWQLQAYDRVLREEEVERTELETVVEYIARNPERANLIPCDGFASYPYTGCLLPGYPELKLFQQDSWQRVWRAMSFIKRSQLFEFPPTNP